MNILLFPSNGDPHGLLTGPLTDARFIEGDYCRGVAAPPYSFLDDHGACPTHHPDPCPSSTCWKRWLPHKEGPSPVKALVLAWGGHPAPEGIDRAKQRLLQHEFRSTEESCGIIWSRSIRSGPECTLGRSIYTLLGGTWDRHAYMRDSANLDSRDAAFPHRQYDELAYPALREYPVAVDFPLRSPWSLGVICAARLPGTTLVVLE